MNTVLVSPKFQVVIPKAIRKQLGLKAGQRIQFVTQGDQIALKPVPSAEEMAGILKAWAHVPFEREDDRSFDGVMNPSSHQAVKK
jgi:AbrB family looped-hinge helix DNA binding protein